MDSVGVGLGWVELDWISTLWGLGAETYLSVPLLMMMKLVVSIHEDKKPNRMNASKPT